MNKIEQRIYLYHFFKSLFDIGIGIIQFLRIEDISAECEKAKNLIS